MFSECFHGNIYSLNEQVVLDFESKDTYLRIKVVLPWLRTEEPVVEHILHFLCSLLAISERHF